LVREGVKAEVTLSKDPDAAQTMKDVKYTGGQNTTFWTFGPNPHGRNNASWRT
jgi:hypothetical protein